MDFDEYIHESEPHKREKGYAWQTAIGLQAVDGLKPSAYLLETARRDIEGEITIDEAEGLIKSYYESKVVRTSEEEDAHEADKASVNIRRILAEKTFAFSLVGLTSIHRRIFNGIYDFAGELRDYNITKKEWILRGDTVLYVSAPDLQKTIEYDLEQERRFDYRNLGQDELVKHIAKFVSGLWQIHPFGEGNTRTTAVFTIKYLRSMGFDVENDLFAKHSWYFRNALVRANYQNIQNGVVYEPIYLERFFRNLLLGEENELKNRYLLISGSKDVLTSTPTSTPASTPTSTPTSSSVSSSDDSGNQNRLIRVLADKQMSVREMMLAVNLKDRSNFLEYTLWPAMKKGLVSMIYPDKPRHPRQKYQLTEKGHQLYLSLTQKI